MKTILPHLFYISVIQNCEKKNYFQGKNNCYKTYNEHLFKLGYAETSMYMMPGCVPPPSFTCCLQYNLRDTFFMILALTSKNETNWFSS